MLARRLVAAVIVSQAIASLSACGDDATEPLAASCDATQPVRVARLGPGIADYIRYTDAGDHLYINIYAFDKPEDPYNNTGPEIGPLVGGQTWITGPCGEDAVLVGEGISFDLESEEFGALTPAFRGKPEADIDPSLACDERGDRGDRTYRVDLTGASPPELLLEGWTCSIDVARMVTTRRTGDTAELWHVPDFPDVDSAVRLAADIRTEVGWDADHTYFLDSTQALHAIDIRTGADEILATGVLHATGGATGSLLLTELGGPTRLLWLASPPGESQATYLYRGETGEAVVLADAAPGDLPEPPQNSWAWRFDPARAYIYHRPFDDPDAPVRVFDLDGALLPFPESLRAERSFILTHGVIASINGSEGPQWVFAQPGTDNATILDIPWHPEIHITTASADAAFFFLADQLYRAPLDGGETTRALDFGYRYADDATLLHHDGELLVVDSRTDSSSVLADKVGTYAPVGDWRDGAFEPRGIFYTDLSAPKSPSLWFIPLALLPGAP